MTPLQTEIEAAHIAENGHRPTKREQREIKALADTGRLPQKVSSRQTGRAIAEAQGLTPALVIDALKDDITAKQGARVKELSLAAKILGLTTDPAATDTTDDVVNVEEAILILRRRIG